MSSCGGPSKPKPAWAVLPETAASKRVREIADRNAELGVRSAEFKENPPIDDLNALLPISQLEFCIRYALARALCGPSEADATVDALERALHLARVRTHEGQTNAEGRVRSG